MLVKKKLDNSTSQDVCKASTRIHHVPRKCISGTHPPEDGEGASIRSDAPASSPLQITTAKIESFKTHHCAMDFDSAFINAVFVKREG